MSLNVNYIKILSTIIIVFTSINNSYSDTTKKANQLNTTQKLLQLNNNKIDKNKQSQDKKQDLETMHENTLNNTQYTLKRRNAITKKLKQDKLGNQQVKQNTNNKVDLTPVQQYNQNKLNNQQILINKSTTFNSEDQIKQFLEEADEITNGKKGIYTNIQNAFNESLKSKGEDTKAILQILLENYKKLYYITLNTKNLVNQYNYGIPNKNDEEGVYNAIRNDKKIEVINNIQQLEYDKYISNTLKTVMNSYNPEYYSNEGWYTKEEAEEFRNLLSNYINEFDVLRLQFLNLCNKHLGTLKQQVKEYLLQNPRKQLNNCVSNTIQYITNTINNILSVIDNQFDKEKLGENTNKLKYTLLEKYKALLDIKKYTENLLNGNTTDEQCKKSLDEFIGKYKMYLTNIVNFFYQTYMKTNYKTEGCKSNLMFVYFINMLINVTTTFIEIFNDTVLTEYNNYINKIYPNQSTHINKIVIY